MSLSAHSARTTTSIGWRATYSQMGRTHNPLSPNRTIQCQLLDPGCRQFSGSSRSSATHYDTLGIAPGSSRLQIKSAFYKLSKKLHPDVNREGDEASKDRFLSVSEAYAVLGDERRKRAYDRTLSASSTGTVSHQHHRAHPHYPDLARRPRATHAWDVGKRNRPQPPPHAGETPLHKHYHYPSAPHARPSTGRTGRASDTLGAANSRLSRWNREVAAEEKIRRDSGVLRLVQVVGVLGVIFTVAGGFK